MKKFSLLALAAAGLLLGACTDKDEVVSEKLNQYDLIEGQSAWIAVGIALPGDPITRANEDLSDGVEAEYQVKSAMLVLFKGATEDEATLIKEYPISSYKFNRETGDNVPGGNTIDTEHYTYTAVGTATGDPSASNYYEKVGDDYVKSSDTSVQNGKTYYTQSSTTEKDGEVTSTSTKIIQEIESPSLGTEDNLYGYVILNYLNNATGLNYVAGTKFSDFKEKVLKAIGIADESKGFGNIGSYGLVMTNVPIADHPGGSSAPVSGTKVTTLAQIDKTAIYDTRAAAEAGSSVACIYVERAAVKVEVENKVEKIELPYGTSYVELTPTETSGKNPSAEKWYEKEGSDYTPTTDITVDGEKKYYKKVDATFLNFTFNGWALGNVNNNGENSGYFNTRQFDTKWLPYINNKCATDYLKYRMVGRTNFFTSGHTTAYRTYFGRDVNYTGTGDIPYNANTGLINAQLTDAQYTLADKAATYTYENTFDENSQIYRNTTYVGFKMTIAGGDFYTIEGQPNTRLLEADLPNEVAKNASSTINTAITNIEDAITDDLAKTDATRQLPTTITKVTFDIEPTVVLGERSTTDGSVAYTYTLKLKNVKDQNGDDLNGENLEKVNTLAGTNLTTVHDGVTKIYKYVGGVVYYATRIAHFGDVETPWDAPAEAYNQYLKVYPADGQSLHETSINYGSNRANAWLGRWGIVRNNWYKLEIDEIKGLGSPVPEDFSGDAGNTPDDNPKPKYYIAAHIHILPWAVRTQSVKF